MGIISTLCEGALSVLPTIGEQIRTDTDTGPTATVTKEGDTTVVTIKQSD